MRISLTDRLTELSTRLEATSNLQEQIQLLIAIQILFQRTLEGREKEERMHALENRTSSSESLAHTHQGWNSLFNVTMAIGQAASTFVGVGQAVEAFKRLSDEGVQGQRVTIQHTIDKINVLLEDLRKDQQKSQEGVAGLFGLLKQIESEAHNTASRVAN